MQTASLPDAGTIYAWLAGIAGGVVSIGAWIVRRLSSQDKALAEIKVALVGYDGKNGIAGDVRASKAAIHDVHAIVQEHDTEIEVVFRNLGMGRREQRR